MAREDNLCCYFHPKEVVVGVCALCLTERLLVLAAKQGHTTTSSTRGTNKARNVNNNNRQSTIHLPKIFAFGSFLNRFEFRHWKSDVSDHDASTSPEDSFISIKFEDNGNPSWEKGTVSKVSLDHCSISWNHHSLTKETSNNNTKNTKTSAAAAANAVIEHAKPLRWRKRIGRLFQLIRWKSRSNGANACHAGSKVEGVKMRKNWIRTLTKRKT
ncbi:hypothetical protein HS088_TW11G00389 [Tripterygium wilfordii]|uniref:Uncharacterized protein n=1 Tax=Tripterygium wilfordii TaxID=458696 RepID=A0A7J7D1T8_TRIWF|nr:uncharacterized protein LOC120008991 [Tripterygium wilfordii]KAF5740322.1 hypothetical protein HS088_TW11G00389 [Tripterygium wilfordii]